MSKPALLLTLSALLLISCQTVSGVSQSPDEGSTSYKAIGTEPFWSLAIEKDALIFSRAGEATVTVSPFEARSSFNGWRYLSDRITVDVTFSPCSDGMSDNRYKDTVTVTIDGAPFKGCGGAVINSGN